MKLFYPIFLGAFLYGCEPMETNPKASIEEAEIAPVVKEEAGKTVASISSDYTKPQKLSANESSNLGQSNAVFRPGALATQSEVSIEEGLDIVDSTSKLELGLEEEYVPYSKPLNISSSTEIDGTVPLSIALEINEDLSLSAALGKIFIVIYILETKNGPKLGVVPTSDIVVSDLIASFDFTTEGSYSKASFQLAAFEFSGALSKEVESSRQISEKTNSAEEISGNPKEIVEIDKESQELTEEEAPEEGITDSLSCQESIDPSTFESGTEICGVLGTLDLSELKPEHIISGQTIAGVQGSLVQENYKECDTDAQQNCLTNSSFPAADSTSLTAKILSGQTVAGVQGSSDNVVYSECTAANQEGCITTSTYKTLDLSAKNSGGTVDITNALFSARVKSSSTFEYWDEQGTRHTNAGDADILEANVLDSAEIFGVTGTAGASPDCSSIAVGGTWIMVPGDSDYGTNDFCVMKYEAKCSLADGQTCTANMSSENPSSTAANTPWVSIEQQDAMTECASLGRGYHLLSNDEYMSIAANITNVASNWNSGTVGSGQLFLGHSDNDPTNECAADSDDTKAYVESDCTAQATGGSEDSEGTERRTMTLSNGEVIWDLSGNVREWVDYFNDEEKPSPNDTLFNEFTLPVIGTSTLPLSDLIPTNALKSFWDDTWNSAEGIGKAKFGLDSSGGAMSRGGGYSGGLVNGIFRLRMDQTASQTFITLGFRCAITRP